MFGRCHTHESFLSTARSGSPKITTILYQLEKVMFFFFSSYFAYTANLLHHRFKISNWPIKVFNKKEIKSLHHFSIRDFPKEFRGYFFFSLEMQAEKSPKKLFSCMIFLMALGRLHVNIHNFLGRLLQWSQSFIALVSFTFFSPSNDFFLAPVPMIGARFHLSKRYLFLIN